MKIRIGRVLLGVVAIVALVISLFALWCHVPLNDPAGLEKVQAGVTERLAQRNSVAKEQNGFEFWRQVWGFKGEPHDEAKQKNSRALIDLASSDHVYSSRTGPLAEEFKKDPARTKSAADQNLAVYPEIKLALDKPYFTYPSQLQPKDLVPNFISLRSVAQGLAGLAAFHAVNGDYPQAVEVSLLSLGFGSKMGGHGTLIEGMIAIAITSIACEPVLDMLDHGLLDAKQCRRLLDGVQALSFKPSQFVDIMDDEFIFGMHFLTAEGVKIDTDQATLAVIARIPVLGPMYLHRERNLYANLYLSERPDIETLKPGTNPMPFLQSHPYDYPLQVIVPNFIRAASQFKFTLVKLGAIKLMAALKIYHESEHKYPASLDLLVPKVLPELPVNLMAQDGKFSYGIDGEDYHLACKSPELSTVGITTDQYGFHPLQPEK